MRALPLVVLLGVVAAAALFFGELRDGMLESDPARDRNRSGATAGGSGAGSGAGASVGSSSPGAGSGSSDAGAQGASARGSRAGSSSGGGSAGGDEGAAGTTADRAASASSETSSDSADPEATGSVGAASLPPASVPNGSQPASAGSTAPALGGTGPSTAPTAGAFPPAQGRLRFGGGSWALDLPSDAGWRQTAVQELSGGRMLLTRLRRDDGTRLVVEHRPGQTAVFGPWPGQAFVVRVPDVGRIDALLFRGGRYAMCREAVCAAVPVNGPSGGVLLIVSAATDVQARRELRRAASGLRVG